MGNERKQDMSEKQSIVKYEIKIIWNNGEEEVRKDVPLFKNVEDWLDAIEEDEREIEDE